jgi:hypothetical protein
MSVMTVAPNISSTWLMIVQPHADLEGRKDVTVYLVTHMIVKFTTVIITK